MNSKKRYSEGKRQEITKIILETGCFVLRDIGLITDKETSMRNCLKRMCDEGTLKYSQKRGENNVATLVNYERMKSDLNEEYNVLKKNYKYFGKQDGYIVNGDSMHGHEKVILNCETQMYMHGAGVKIFRGEKPLLHKEEVIEGNVFYDNREVKSYDDYSTSSDRSTGKITGLTRVNGILVSEGGSYCVYDAYNNIMKCDSGELRMKIYADELLRKKCLPELKGAVLLTKDYSLQKRYVEEYEGITVGSIDALFRNYPKVYALTLDKEGQRMMKLMMTPKWEEKIYKMFITSAAGDFDGISSDGKDEEGKYTLIYLVPDIKKLRDFIAGAKAKGREYCKIICFDWQKDFIKDVAKNYAKVYTVKQEMFEEEFYKEES